MLKHQILDVMMISKIAQAQFLASNLSVKQILQLELIRQPFCFSALYGYYLGCTILQSNWILTASISRMTFPLLSLNRLSTDICQCSEIRSN